MWFIRADGNAINLAKVSKLEIYQQYVILRKIEKEGKYEIAHKTFFKLGTAEKDYWHKHPKCFAVYADDEKIAEYDELQDAKDFICNITATINEVIFD